MDNKRIDDLENRIKKIDNTLGNVIIYLIVIGLVILLFITYFYVLLPALENDKKYNNLIENPSQVMILYCNHFAVTKGALNQDYSLYAYSQQRDEKGYTLYKNCIKAFVNLELNNG